ncbi:MAG: hypothetical protein PH343_09970 [Nitrospira sp.]|nr:hypothetical protein [Nitrospira sp.]
MRLKILLLIIGILFILISAYAQGDIETNNAGAVSIDKTTTFVTDK